MTTTLHAEVVRLDLNFAGCIVTYALGVYKPLVHLHLKPSVTILIYDV